jgi:sirohydrochlorin ferrochelatase
LSTKPDVQASTGGPAVTGAPVAEPVTGASEAAAVVVSHGQPSDPEVAEREVADVAAAVAEHLAGWSVRGATLAGEGTLERAVTDAGPGCVIYPLFMADGWFTRSVLPQRLDAFDTVQLPPLGADPGLVAVAGRWLAAEIDSAGWDPAEVDLLVAGHGSGRSAGPAEATEHFARTVAPAASIGGAVRCGYVEQVPFLADAARTVGARSFCLPFFAARRGHVLADIPEALDAARFAGRRLDPIGCHPEVPGLVAEAISRGSRTGS